MAPASTCATQNKLFRGSSKRLHPDGGFFPENRRGPCDRASHRSAPTVTHMGAGGAPGCRARAFSIRGWPAAAAGKPPAPWKTSLQLVMVEDSDGGRRELVARNLVKGGSGWPLISPGRDGNPILCRRCNGWRPDHSFLFPISLCRSSTDCVLWILPWSTPPENPRSFFRFRNDRRGARPSTRCGRGSHRLCAEEPILSRLPAAVEARAGCVKCR